MALEAPGLPNIVGTLQHTLNFVNGAPTVTGAFKNSSRQNQQPYDGNVDQPMMGRIKIDFNASQSNSIYGASSTVQPPALQLIPQIKF